MSLLEEGRGGGRSVRSNLVEELRFKTASGIAASFWPGRGGEPVIFVTAQVEDRYGVGGIPSRAPVSSARLFTPSR